MKTEIEMVHRRRHFPSNETEGVGAKRLAVKDNFMQLPLRLSVNNLPSMAESG